MTDDSALEGVDPYDALDVEAGRIDSYCTGLADDDPAWGTGSRCAGWSVRDVLAHLVSTEDYFAAGFNRTVQEYVASAGARGATDIASFNAMGVEDQAGRPPSELLAEWRRRNAETRRRFRERDGETVDTSVGDYPARWQAFHVASELATHADDMHIPETDDERARRTAWRAPFSRFSLVEAKPELVVEVTTPGRTRVSGEGIDLDVDDETFVAAVAGRDGDPTLRPLSTAV
jgi:uncharacterized protein (TIGR03083 family)